MLDDCVRYHTCECNEGISDGISGPRLTVPVGLLSSRSSARCAGFIRTRSRAVSQCRPPNVAPTHTYPIESACASGAGVATPTERPPNCEECGRHGACVANKSCVPPLAPHTRTPAYSPRPPPSLPRVRPRASRQGAAAASSFLSPSLERKSGGIWGLSQLLSVDHALPYGSRRRRCSAQQGLMHGFQSRFSIPPRHHFRRCATR